MTLYRTTINAPAPVHELEIIASDDGVVAILWPSDARWDYDDVNDVGNTITGAAAAQLTEYFAGDRTQFELPLDLRGTDFQQEVWRSLADIPFGTTVSYGEQAKRLGRPSSVRAVASANGRNPVSIVLPCHRVIGSDGKLTGYAGGLDAKRWLLALEADQQALV
ncbi:MAG: methylated-DNA--[protein]-cysteine S-methyltransferase [Acidimicrobiales bacterium]|nr:methylated-DNA--[protein]-cysteine S-methyltransferase [Acidimicrobiales bacterium]